MYRSEKGAGPKGWPQKPRPYHVGPKPCIQIFLMTHLKIIIASLFLALLFLCSAPTPVQAQAPEPAPLVLERALDSGGRLFNGGMIQDRDGFFWIATLSGLLKWDGYTLKKPKGSPEAIYGIYEDTQGLIWVSSSVGLSMYDKSVDVFTVYRHDPNDPKSIGEGTSILAMQSIAEDSSGNIWFGTQKGLNRYDKQTKAFTVYTHNPADPNSLGNNNVTALWADQQATLWVGTEGGLDKFNPSTGTFTHYRNQPDDPRSLSHNIVTALLKDRNGVLWVGTKEGGLNRFDQSSGAFTRYLYDPENPHSLKDNFVFAITEVDANELWLTHWDNTSGIDIFDTETGVFHNYRDDPDNPGRQSYNQTANVYKDRSGIIWVVHFNGMLDKIDPVSTKFTLYQHEPGNTNSLAENSVFGVYQDKQGMMWISFAGKGLDKFDRQTHTFTHYPDMPGGLAQSIVEDDSGLFWLAGNGGIFTFDKTSGKYSETYLLQCKSGQIIIPDRNDANILWVGTDTGLVKFDKSTKKWIKFRHAPNNPDSICNDTMWHLCLDKAGFIWIPTYGGGLDKFDPKAEKVVAHYKNNPDDPKSLGSDTLNHVFQDSAGRIWVGTVDSGLNKLNPDGTFTRYNEETGFLTNWVGSIIEDNQGFLWLGTKIGLIKFDPQTETWRRYTQDDGLQSNEFLEYPNFKAPDGELWVFGGNGLNSFYPDKLKDNPYKPPVYFTSLTQGNELLKDVTQAPERVTEITLSWQSNFFEFEVSALNFTRPEKNQYQYVLEGFDNEWYHAGTKRTGRYSNLPDGTYTLRVRGANNDGVWSDQEATLKVTVVGPFWRTTWFRLLLGLAILLSAYGVALLGLRASKAQHRAAEKRQREMERKVADRTVQLAVANKELEAFAYTVSHDLRAPLRHIDGFLELLKKETGTALNEQSRHYMDAISEAAKKMGLLIDDLLSFSRMGRHALSFNQVALGTLVRDVVRELELDATGRTIEWRIGDLPSVTGDERMLRIVLTNLISNALKFTRTRPQACIEIGSLPDQDSESVIFVRDNGVGFDMAYAQKLFGVFQRLHRADDFEGTGIGLASVRRIIGRHGGRTWAQGEPDQGAAFFFTLPRTLQERRDRGGGAVFNSQASPL